MNINKRGLLAAGTLAGIIAALAGAAAAAPAATYTKPVCTPVPAKPTGKAPVPADWNKYCMDRPCDSYCYWDGYDPDKGGSRPTPTAPPPKGG